MFFRPLNSDYLLLTAFQGRDVVVYQPVWKDQDEIPPLISEADVLQAVIARSTIYYDEPTYSLSSCAPVTPSLPLTVADIRLEVLKARHEEEALLLREEEKRRAHLESAALVSVSPSGADLQRGERYANTDYAFMSALWRGSNNIKFWYDPASPPYEPDCCPGCMCYSCSGMHKAEKSPLTSFTFESWNRHILVAFCTQMGKDKEGQR
ncbi:hypothetical protein C8R47DRAFT_1076088 [Mycena vitilis]|nr:hypothetical protein C8R47DRAFT_1076088 [Mycena vitilis]